MNFINVRILSSTLLFATVLLAILVSKAQADVYPDFASTAGLTLNGSAAGNLNNGIDPNPVLRLARAIEGQAGSAFSSVAVTSEQFSTFFQFRITNPGGDSDGTDRGGDGFVFAIQSVRPDLVGNGGSGLGYEGLNSSVGVEFDTWNSRSFGFDSDSNHVGVNVNGNVDSRQETSVSPRFDDGKLWSAWIDYNGNTIEVRANQTGVRPTTATLVYLIDIPEVIGRDTAFVGFTAGTGGTYENFDIVTWEHQDDVYENPNSETFSPWAAEWRYADNGTNQGTAWRDRGFTDSQWPRGDAPLGYGDDDEATTVSCGATAPQCNADNHATTYFRRTFDVQNVALIQSLDAQLLRDDAAAVYLNGVEVFRDDNLPAAASYTTFATSQGTENGIIAFAIDPSLLTDGDNVLAVEVHQVLPTSSDISFDLRLTGTVNAIPEPTTFTFAVLGLLGFVVRGRRRRARS